MKRTLLIFVFGSIVGFSTMAGIWYTLLRQDPAWLEEQRAAFERDQELERAASNQACDCAPDGEASPVADTGPQIEAGAEVQEKIFVFKSGGFTKVSYYSEAPIKDIVGINQDVNGQLRVDINDPNRLAEGGVVLKMAGFNTGIPLRDEHFRAEKWLDTEQYPEAVFKITKVETKNRIEFGKVANGTIHGTMRLKEHTYNLKVPITARYLEATEELQKMRIKTNLLVVEGTFSLDLTPLKLSGMENSGGKKIAKVLKVHLKLAGSEQAPVASSPTPIP